MEKTMFAYYNGAYGPTLLIDVLCMNWFILFRDTLKNLLDNVISEIDFLQFENIEISNVGTFKFVKSAKSSYPSIKIKNGVLNFTWFLNCENLYHILGLIDGFDEGETGHQYLMFDEKVLIIELAYNETHRKI